MYAAGPEEAAESYLLTPVMPEDRFKQAMALAAALAVLLGGRINCILIDEDPGDPHWIREAKEIAREQAALPMVFESGDPAEASRYEEFAGMSHLEFRDRFRLERACACLLDSGIPIADILDLCGYRSGCEMDRAFRQYLGQTPAEYRERMISNDQILAAWPELPVARDAPGSSFSKTKNPTS